MNQIGNQLYRFADIEVDASQFCLKRGSQEQPIRHKALQVLIYLLENRSRLVTKDELFATIWKNTAVTDDVLVQSVKEIRRILGDDPRNPRFIKTVPRRGYRFLAPVEESLTTSPSSIEHEQITAFEVEFEEESDGLNWDQATASNFFIQGLRNAGELAQAGNETTQLHGVWIAEHPAIQTVPSTPRVMFEPLNRRSLRLRLAVGAALVLALLALFGGALILRRGSSARPAVETVLPLTPGKRALAVMYFDNQSSSAELDWLREGLADMLITNLSRSKRLSVLSRQQLHLLIERAGRQPVAAIRLDEALDLAHKSQAEIIILGSFAKLGEKVHIEAQIHDANTGRMLAAEGLTADAPEQILAGVDALSLKLASRLGVTAEANEHSLAAVMTDNLNAYRYYSLALEQVQMFQFSQAIELLEKAIALDGEFAMAYARIGYVYAVRLGQGEKAKPYFAKATQFGNRLSNKERLFIAAWSANANYDSNHAIQTYQDLLTQYPLEVEAYQRLGWLLIAQERYQDALDTLKRGSIIDPEAKDLYNAMGDAYLMLGKNEEAETAWERYIQLAPQDPNAYDSLGTFQEWLGHYDEAIATYNRALTINPESGIAIIHLGNTYFQQGRYQAAIAQYQRFAEIAQNDGQRARASECLAKVYLQKGDLKRASFEAKKAVQLNRLNNTAILYSAWASGDKTAAENFKRNALATSLFAQLKHGGFLRFYYFLQGSIALEEGRGDEAIEHFKETIRHRPLSWYIDSYEDCLANAYLRLGRFDEAIAEYQRILNINPNYPLAHFHLAQAFEYLGERPAAREYYQKFLQIWNRADSDIPQVISAKERLQALP